MIAALAAGLAVAGCDGNPFNPDDDTGGGGGEVTEDGVTGTANPSPSRPLVRYEARSETTGSGYAENITYDSANDTYSVDNLGFDGDNLYERGSPVATLGSFNVYEPATVVNDPVTGQPISQFQHRLIAGISTSGDTEFALVRTGQYIDYGFGGFVLRRNSGVTLPTDGQAAYQGDYGGLRDFIGRSGLEYVTGDMDVAIDFRDFNDGDAVQGFVRNRRIFDTAGNDITGTVLAAWAANPDVNQTTLPTLVFTVGPGVIDRNGELRGDIGSAIRKTDGGLEGFEEGKFYGVVAGDNADEIVGVIVVEAEDPRSEDVTVRESGAFILYRNP
jgi:hypothetical protein